MKRAPFFHDISTCLQVAMVADEVFASCCDVGAATGVRRVALTAASGNDYHAACLEPVRRMVASLIHLPTRVVPSDRLPAYSEVTMDIEVDNGDNWMEVCSVSRRTDFPQRYRTQPKKGAAVDHDVLLLEIRHRSRPVRLQLGHGSRSIG
ncbi:hypothetical protein REMIM1_CH02355 [Rhizobium etli bv. mimosae str. Mim1]|nr:hypothetical protein REMIM1_CH02355 [Rhizobium etli bv. mimosae str. Mim1]